MLQFLFRNKVQLSGIFGALCAAVVTVLLVPYAYDQKFFYTNFEVGMISWNDVKKVGDLLWPKIFFITFGLSALTLFTLTLLLEWFFVKRKSAITTTVPPSLHFSRAALVALLPTTIIAICSSGRVVPDCSFEWVLIYLTVIVIVVTSCFSVERARKELIIFASTLALLFLTWCSYEVLRLLFGLYVAAAPPSSPAGDYEVHFWLPIIVALSFYFGAHWSRLTIFCKYLFKAIQLPLPFLATTIFWKWEQANPWVVSHVGSGGLCIVVIGLFVLFVQQVRWLCTDRQESLTDFLLHGISIPSMIGVALWCVAAPVAPSGLGLDDFHMGEILVPWQQVRDFHSIIPFDVTARLSLSEMVPAILNELLFDGSVTNLFWCYSIVTSILLTAGAVYLSRLINPLFAFYMIAVLPSTNDRFTALPLAWLFLTYQIKDALTWRWILIAFSVAVTLFAWMPGSGFPMIVTVGLSSLYLLHYAYAASAPKVLLRIRNAWNGMRETLRQLRWKKYGGGMLLLVIAPCLLQSVLIIRDNAPVYVVEHSTPLNFTTDHWMYYPIQEWSSLYAALEKDPARFDLGVVTGKDIIEVTRSFDTYLKGQFDLPLARLLYEVRRFGGWIAGFVFISIYFVSALYRRYREGDRVSLELLFFLTNALVFSWFIITYAMARIDEGGWSRCGAVSLFLGLFVLPTVVALSIKKQQRFVLPLVFVASVVALYLPEARVNVVRALSRYERAVYYPQPNEVIDGPREGIPGVGHARHGSDKIQDLRRVRDAVLKVHGTEKEGIFESINRPALYYYLGLKIPSPDIGFFAMPAGNALRNAVKSFDRHPPRTMLAGPVNNFDGIVFPLRTFLVYRWFMEHGFFRGERAQSYYFLQQGAPNDLFEVIRRGWLQEDIGRLAIGWGRSISTLRERMDRGYECALSLKVSDDTRSIENSWMLLGSSGLLSLTLTPPEECKTEKNDLLWIEVERRGVTLKKDLHADLSWQREGVQHSHHIKFIAQPGTLLVPIAIDPHWYTEQGATSFTLKVQGDHAGAKWRIKVKNLVRME